MRHLTVVRFRREHQREVDHWDHHPSDPGGGRIAVGADTGVNARIDDLNGRLERLEADVRDMDARLRAVEVAFAKVDQRLETLERALLPAPAPGD